ncbi:MAG: S-adenosylmethionine:tRNA ribosyltransferase-isomerase [Tannerella sp.]|jgi:S-adenosylmethionine:tRNA ribosyltransferase-isomerase|nr:S-adenosylmethionine:tRNA ribosyltransferase-isomerase [Tannerella sp.]
MFEKEIGTPATVHQINISEYDYPLPDDRIAKFPLHERDKSKLLTYRNGEAGESVFSRIADFLPEKSLIVFNNTRVIRARLLFAKDTGAQIEVFCLEPEEPRDYAMNFQACGQCRWTCLVGNLKRWKEGVLERTLLIGNDTVKLTVERKQAHGHTHSILFRWNPSSHTFAEILETAGVLPIPPYLNRKTEQSDLQTYQTVYSKIKGSVAAPTAGLHFTPEILDTLDRRGFIREEITLHVGAGTFKPVQTGTIGEHEMHTEFFSVDRPVIARLLAHAGRVTAVGTTSVRTLESLYYTGAMLAAHPDATPEMLAIKQWTPYRNELPPIPAGDALRNILNYLDKNNLEKLTASTRIIIVPGYEFHIVNNMITNFHQPKSTLLLLVSAFVKGDWKKIYDYALTHGFRFLSYGDASFLAGG